MSQRLSSASFLGKTKKKTKQNHPTKCRENEIYIRSSVSLSSWPLPHFCLTTLHNSYCILILFRKLGFYIFFCRNIILIFNFLFSLCLPTTQTMGFILCRIFVVAFAPNFNLILIFFSYFVHLFSVWLSIHVFHWMDGSGGQDYQGT